MVVQINLSLQSNMKKLNGFLLIVLFFATTVILLAAVVRGEAGNPVYHQAQEERSKKVGSPFESSGTTSRYALIEAMVEDKTFFFNESRAKRINRRLIYQKEDILDRKMVDWLAIDPDGLKKFIERASLEFREKYGEEP